MTDQTNQSTAEQAATIEEFNSNVSTAISATFHSNRILMDDGISTVAVALANGLSAADLTAAIAVENGRTAEDVANMLDNMLDDMKGRAAAAAAHFIEMKAKLATEAANDSTAKAA